MEVEIEVAVVVTEVEMEVKVDVEVEQAGWNRRRSIRWRRTRRNRKRRRRTTRCRRKRGKRGEEARRRTRSVRSRGGGRGEDEGRGGCQLVRPPRQGRLSPARQWTDRLGARPLALGFPARPAMARRPPASRAAPPDHHVDVQERPPQVHSRDVAIGGDVLRGPGARARARRGGPELGMKRSRRMANVRTPMQARSSQCE